MIWEDINQASAKDWDDFWKAVKLNNVQFRRTEKREQRKIINIFDEFPKDVLIELYKDKDVVCITEYFLDAISNAKYDGGKLIDEDNLLSDKFYNHLSLTNASTALQNRQFRSDKERIRLIRKRDACLALENILDTKYYEPEYFENNLTYSFFSPCPCWQGSTKKSVRSTNHRPSSSLEKPMDLIMPSPSKASSSK